MNAKYLLTKLTILLVAIAATMLPGCTGNPQRDQIVVDIGLAAVAPIVGNYIRNAGDAAAQSRRAENIVAVSAVLAGLVSSEPVSIRQLVSAAQARYPANYTVQEREEADALLLALSAGLRSLTVDGLPLGDDARVRVTDLLDMVTQTAGRYVQPSSGMLLRWKWSSPMWA